MFEIALKAATEHINFFVEESGVFDKTLDSQNPILFQKLKPSILKTVSVLEINQLSESLFIKARCLRSQEKAKSGIEQLKNLCLQANLGLLALEASAVGESYVMGKKILMDLYNHLGDLVKIKSKYLFQTLIKMYIFLQEIPQQYWDNFFR